MNLYQQGIYSGQEEMEGLSMKSFKIRELNLLLSLLNVKNQAVLNK